MALSRLSVGNQRLIAFGAAALVLIVFFGANALLVSVAVSSQPDCVLQPETEGAAHLRAAKSSC